MEATERNTLNLMVNTVQKLSLARDMDTVTKIVRTVARQLTGADGASFVLREGNLCYYADEDAISPLWKGSRFPMQTCISGWAMMNKESAVIEDIYQDNRIPQDAYRPTFVKSLAMVPIRKIDPIGAIGNYWATKRRPSEDEVSLLQSLADITAVTIENINMYNELEDRVKMRTEQLEELNKELESFSYSVSHDLRAPLRGVIGYSDILYEDNLEQLNEAGRNVLSSIRTNAKRMNTLIDDLLQFSRLGKKPIEKTEVNNGKLVKHIIEELRHSDPNKAQINIQQLHSAVADEVLIRQVWFNLISNAIKYSSKKENPSVEIGSYRNTHEVVYVVKDNGAGFDMNYAGKLFGAFQRLHKLSEFPGSGVGLALSNRIVSRHGGKMWAEARVDEGATFYFSLPVGH